MAAPARSTGEVSAGLVERARDGDRRAMGQVITLVRPMAKAIAKQMHRDSRLSGAVDREDLEQAGLIAVTKAVENFDRAKSNGAKFQTFAHQHIRGAILRLLKKNLETPALEESLASDPVPRKSGAKTRFQAPSSPANAKGQLVAEVGQQGYEEMLTLAVAAGAMATAARDDLPAIKVALARLRQAERALAAAAVAGKKVPPLRNALGYAHLAPQIEAANPVELVRGKQLLKEQTTRAGYPGLDLLPFAFSFHTMSQGFAPAIEAIEQMLAQAEWQAGKAKTPDAIRDRLAVALARLPVTGNHAALLEAALSRGPHGQARSKWRAQEDHKLSVQAWDRSLKRARQELGITREARRWSPARAQPRGIRVQSRGMSSPVPASGPGSFLGDLVSQLGMSQ
jgi:RNA polymerase sigma factor (sigma-70 family)